MHSLFSLDLSFKMIQIGQLSLHQKAVRVLNANYMIISDLKCPLEAAKKLITFFPSERKAYSVLDKLML